MSHSIAFKTFWNVVGSGGIYIPPDTMTEPDQNCLTIREILTRFGVLPEMSRVAAQGGAYASEEEALAASAFAVSDKTEALERAMQLAEELASSATVNGTTSETAEEGPIQSPPQAGKARATDPPSRSVAEEEASVPEA